MSLGANLYLSHRVLPSHGSRNEALRQSWILRQHSVLLMMTSLIDSQVAVSFLYSDSLEKSLEESTIPLISFSYPTSPPSILSNTPPFFA